MRLVADADEVWELGTVLGHSIPAGQHEITPTSSINRAVPPLIFSLQSCTLSGGSQPNSKKCCTLLTLSKLNMHTNKAGEK